MVVAANQDIICAYKVKFDYSADDKTASTAKIRDDEISIDDRTTHIIADTNTSSSNATSISTNITTDNKIFKKILLIPSILLTKGLITSHVKASTSQINHALNFLLENDLLLCGKYLHSGKRKFDAYLKYVPENIDSPITKYLLQGKLLRFDVNVNEYIKSLKTITFSTASIRPSDALLTQLNVLPYLQLQIDCFSKREKEADENESPENDADLIKNSHRKKKKRGDEDE
ncbi:unnamed protein product [Didymodactylos carnosus]|uniref:Uncharacterized protein n=1 Tax=Didymodactylos carnosus TaxID=1234261 RepID=A0A8S2F319_9BILA|nr:unnamed protein product [Didymodactylos carnosus]CAF4189292.1 unnamed protein product [Didymodactylos carnosus]